MSSDKKQIDWSKVDGFEGTLQVPVRHEGERYTHGKLLRAPASDRWYLQLRPAQFAPIDRDWWAENHSGQGVPQDRPAFGHVNGQIQVVTKWQPELRMGVSEYVIPDLFSEPLPELEEPVTLAEMIAWTEYLIREPREDLKDSPGHVGEAE